MNKIYFNNETKVFGILSDRVRKSTLDQYKSKYGEDSDEYKDRVERDELLNRLENLVSESKKPYGYAYSSDNTVKSAESEGKFPNGFIRNSNDSNPHRSKYMWDGIDYKREKLRDSIRYNTVLHNKYVENSNKFIKDLQKYKNGVRKLTPSVINKINKLGGTVINTDKISTMEYNPNRSGFIIDLNKNGSDYEVSHELQHALNNIYTKESPGDKYDISKLMVDDYDGKSPNGPFNGVNDVLNYVTNVSSEELSANRGRLMNNYLYGGNDLTDSDLLNSYNEGELAQSIYDSSIGGYRPPSLRYHMPRDIVNSIKSKLN